MCVCVCARARAHVLEEPNTRSQSTLDLESSTLSTWDPPSYKKNNNFPPISKQQQRDDGLELTGSPCSDSAERHVQEEAALPEFIVTLLPSASEVRFKISSRGRYI